MITWEQIYDFFGIRDFIYFISSPAVQRGLLPIKLVFIFFALFFLVWVFYFYINSSYLKYQFLQDATEFFSWQPYGLRQVNKRWNKLVKKTESGLESDFKLAIIDADEFLYQVLEERGYRGETFDELMQDASKRVVPHFEEILAGHALRNSIVYEPDFSLNIDQARQLLTYYENAIKNIAIS